MTEPIEMPSLTPLPNPGDAPVDAFIKALVGLQAELPVVTKNAVNPHFGSKFADLATIIETVRPLLAKHGFALTQHPEHHEGQPTLVTRLWHSGGSSVRSEMLLCMGKNDPQSQGSALTYARRYAISAILGLATEEDDDGNAASAPSKAPQATQRRPPLRHAQTFAEEAQITWRDL